jgi:hypothetical protein
MHGITLSYWLHGYFSCLVREIITALFVDLQMTTAVTTTSRLSRR